MDRDMSYEGEAAKALDQQPSPELAPLAYHRDLVAYLQRAEGHVWDWVRSEAAERSLIEETREAILKQTYRLDSSSHPAVFEACRIAMTRLGLDLPVTLYQGADGAMNAQLCYIPGELHLVFHGPILERLDEHELLALMGHELSHYLLWSAEGGIYFDAYRIIDMALSNGSIAPAHAETARLLSLHTEVFADRGAAIAAGAAEPAISTLVKTMTGLSHVDPASYLRQAEELENNKDKSAGLTHPESYLRARAVDLWWRGATGMEDWLQQRLRGLLSITSLDLLGQQSMTALTQDFLASFLGGLSFTTDEALAQARQLLPDLIPARDAFAYAAISRESVDDASRDYFVSLMLDCAMADPDAMEAILEAAAREVTKFGAEDRFALALTRDLKWTKPRIRSLLAAAGKVRQSA